MLGGLFGDLPPPSQTTSGAPSLASSVVPQSLVHNTSSSASIPVPSPVVATPSKSKVTALTPSSLRKAPAILAPPPSVLRHQQQQQQQQEQKVSKATKVAVAVTTSTAAAAAARPNSNIVLVSQSQSQATTGGRWSEPELASTCGGTTCGTTATGNVVVQDEYDPARPNDYEDYCRERKKRKMEEEMKRDIEKRRQEEEERERERELTRQKELHRQKELEKEVHISGEEAWKRRGMLSNNRAPPPSSPPPSPPPSSGNISGNNNQQQQQQPTMSAAQRMMARMGWKEGQGLGKQEQGITTALVARKTDKRAGVIVNAGEAKKLKHTPPPPVTTSPTRVVLLRNMVGPGQVDGELEDEVASECSKFGVVTGVLIYEIIEADFAPTEAVRIFIQFEKMEQAGKALADLDGRYFGGRVVKASFFDEDRFNKRELAPRAGE